MRFVLVTALLALGLSVGVSLPAAASGSSDHVRQKDVRDRASGDDESRPARRRVARATTGDIDEEYEARPRQRYEASDDDRPRASQRRQARAVKRSKHRHATRRSGRRVAQHRTNRRTARADRSERTARRISRERHYSGAREINGIASYYWQDQRVATGARFNPEGMTAAHRTLPFGTRVRVTHMGNGRSVNVVINDRGPFIAGRIIDLARGAARMIGMTGQGLARVNVTVLGR